MKRLGALAILLLLQLPHCLFATEPSKSSWISIDYSDLVDKSAIIRTGQTLSSALGSPSLKGALQPFLDKYSTLLEYAVEMTNHEETPLINVASKYSPGSAQPAWVALFRSGKFSAYTDNRNIVRLFIQGQNPQSAYAQTYPIIRHMLNSLRPSWGKLQIDVYAFENDYQTLTLRLSPIPAHLSGSYFGTPKGKIALDLDGLRRFFEQNGQLEGAALNTKSGLQLFARAAGPQTLAGSTVKLADFAVAYRAVFHAGENKAFISLDPNKDITKAAVNFGGYLEDTAIGRVVLESDKRFKTITSGLDPNSCKDIRQYTRQYVPDYLSVSERELSTYLSKNNWIKTRFWFYPDSIEVQTDASGYVASIINPHFLADAERSRDDFNSNSDYERKRKALLLPAIRDNIDALNRHFDDYAQAFPEFRELVTVGRLMAICSWLYRANPQWIDLDALLSVTLPAVSTERERTQLMAAATLPPSQEALTADFIKTHLIITYLTPELDKAISDYFGDSHALAQFLAEKAGRAANEPQYYAQAAALLRTKSSQPVRTLIKTQSDLQAFALFAGHKQQPLSAKDDYQSIDEENKQLVLQDKELTMLQAQLSKTRTQLADGTVTSDEAIANYNTQVNAMNKQINDFQQRTHLFNQKVAQYNLKQNAQSPLLVEIGGGINLESESFKIHPAENSPKLSAFKVIASKAKTDWTDLGKNEKWITNKISPSKEESQRNSDFTTPPRIITAKPKNYASKKGGPPTASIKQQPLIVREPEILGTKIRGEMVDEHTIVFKRFNP